MCSEETRNSDAIKPSDPRASYLAHRGEIDRVVADVLTSDRYILGSQVAGFEKEFAEYVDAPYSVGVASGTDALHLALRACGVGSGHEVATVSHTAVATVAAIQLAGAEPVLVDVNPRTFTMDVDQLEALVTRSHHRLKAVIPVHLYGHPADMPAIMEISSRAGLWVIEDCAQSHGAALKGRRTGAWGHMAAFSFYPTKNLAAIGDGGALTTANADLVRKARLLREYGWQEKRVSTLRGMNSRLDELQAAVLRVKLRYLDSDNSKRQMHARVYDRLLRGLDLTLPTCGARSTHVYHQYVVRSRDRDGLRRYLDENGVITLVHYPVPVHHQPAYEGVTITGEALSVTEAMSREVLSLPIYPELPGDSVEHVAELVEHYLQSSH